MKREDLADGVTIYLGSFIDVMPLLPDKSINHVICDAPYEDISHAATGTIRRNDGRANPEALDFAGVSAIRPELAKMAAEKCTGWCLFFSSPEGIAPWRDEIEANGIKYKLAMAWVKPDSAPRFNGQGPSHGYESIVLGWCGTGYSSWNGGGRRGVLTHAVNPPSRDGTHPTQKPISLMTELVGLFTNPGDIICDPCMGSGSTGLACVRMGRKFIGMEIDEKYFTAARVRISTALSQPDMFIEVPKFKQGKLF